MASLFIAVIYLAFISLGLPDSLLGSAWPVMHTELGASLSSAASSASSSPSPPSSRRSFPISS